MKQILLFIKTITLGLLFTGFSQSNSLQAQPTTWLGLEDSDWFNANNWSPPGVPGPTSDVMIDGFFFNPLVIGSGFAEAANISNQGSLLITPLGRLTVYATFTNFGVLVMESDADNSASFICPDFQNVAGSFSYERFLGVSVPNNPEYGWHYISSPVATFGSHNMMDYYISTWDETTSLWVQHPGQADCVPAPEIFNDGMNGWSVKLDEAFNTYGCPDPGTGMTVEFLGQPNSGNFPGEISASNNGGFPNFNLVGQPYPSYWDYDAFFFGPNWPAGLFDAIYFWDESTNQYASYVNGIGANGGDNVVPPAQAFFFECDGTQPTVPLLFMDSERTHNDPLPFWKDTETDLVRLQATANGITDETVIRFSENSTINRDKNDARKIKSSGTGVPALYTMAGDISLSINGLPATDIVPVYFECKTAGTYTIEATETSDFTHLVLEDLVTGALTDLLKDSYTFSYTSANDVRNFKLLFAPVGIEDMEASNIKIWSGTNNIFVEVPENTNGDIAIYNMLGQEMLHTAIVSGSVNTIPMEASNSYYIVKVLTGNNAITGKVFIK